MDVKLILTGGGEMISPTKLNLVLRKQKVVVFLLTGGGAVFCPVS